MTTFDDLRALYIGWSNRHREYFEDSYQFICRFAVQFGKYIGAPETYKEMSPGGDPKKAPTKRYVGLLRAIKDDGGKVHLNEAEFPMDVVTPDDGGYWISGIKVTIDRAENTYPKSEFTFPVRFTLEPGQSRLQIGDRPEGKFEIEANNPDSFKTAYEYMVSLLRGVFESPPWSSSKKTEIGFAPPEKEAP